MRLCPLHQTRGKQQKALIVTVEWRGGHGHRVYQSGRLAGVTNDLGISYTWSCCIGCLVHGLPLVSMSPFSRGFRVCHQILHKWPRNEGRMNCRESHRETWGGKGAQPGRGTDNFEPHSSGESLGIWPPLPAGKVGLSMCPEEKRSKLNEHSIVFVTWSKGTGKHKMSSVWLIQILVTFIESRWLSLLS